MLLMVTLIIRVYRCVCHILLGSHFSYCDMLVNCTMTCETIDIIGIVYFTLRTGRFLTFKCYR